MLVLPGPGYCNLLLMHRKLWHGPHRCRLPRSILARCLWLPLCIIRTPLASLAIIQQCQRAQVVMVTSASWPLIYFILDWCYQFIWGRASYRHAAVKIHWVYCSGAVTTDKRICSPYGHPHHSPLSVRYRYSQHLGGWHTVSSPHTLLPHWLFTGVTKFCG